jgi:hypothetical protein
MSGMTQWQPEGRELVRAALAKAIRLCETPGAESLERSAEALGGAVAVLQAGPPVTTARDLAEWRRTLYRLRRLLDAAAQYHDGWTRRLGALTGGYTAAGTAAPVNPGRRWLGQG